MTPVTDLEQTSAFSAAKALAGLDRGRRAAEAASGLGVSQQRLMWLFRDGGARTLKEVAEALGLEQSTVNRQVNAALDAGILRRFQAEGQAAHLLEATTEGSARFAQDLTTGLQQLQVALEVVPEGRRDRFVADLLAFAEAYDTATRG